MSTQFSKRELFSKHALGAGLGVGALALLAPPPYASADVPFTSFPFPATGATMPRTMPDRLAEVVNVKDFGAHGDGVTNDAPAIQAAIDAAYGPAASPHGGIAENVAKQNRSVYFPPGYYVIHTPINLFMVSGAHIFGAGRHTVLIHNNAGGSVFVANGFMYSKVENMTLRCEISGVTNAVCFDADWDGTSTYSVQLQQNTFQNISFGGGGFGLRIANSGFQGDTHLIINCDFRNCRVAGIYVQAQNSIQNQMIGGNVASCGNGIWGAGGFLDSYYGVNFQVNGGFDDNACDIRFDGNQGNGVIITGCRTESTNFVRSLAGANIVIAGCAQQGPELGDFFQTNGGTCEVIGCVSYNGRIIPQYWANIDIRNSLFYRSDWLFINSPQMWFNKNGQSPFHLNAKNVLNVVTGTQDQTMWMNDSARLVIRNRGIEGNALTDNTVVYAGQTATACTIPQIGTATVFDRAKHNLAPGTPVAFFTSAGGSLPTGLSAGRVYYVISVPVTVDIANSLFTTANNHGLVVGDLLCMATTGTYPTGIRAKKLYTVAAAGLTATTFKLLTIPETTTVVLSGSFSGTISYFGSGNDNNTSKFQVSATKGGASVSTSGSLTGTCFVTGVNTFQVGDVVTKSNVAAGDPPGWVCTTTGEALTGGTAVFRPLPVI